MDSFFTSSLFFLPPPRLATSLPRHAQLTMTTGSTLEYDAAVVDQS